MWQGWCLSRKWLIIGGRLKNFVWRNEVCLESCGKFTRRKRQDQINQLCLVCQGWYLWARYFIIVVVLEKIEKWLSWDITNTNIYAIAWDVIAIPLFYLTNTPLKDCQSLNTFFNLYVILLKVSDVLRKVKLLFLTRNKM